MPVSGILRARLRAQLIEGSTATSASDVVSRLLAMQAQDYAGALWAIGLRSPGSTAAGVEQAIAERAIVRTWPMRGTLHFVAAGDVRWMLRLLAPRVLGRAAARERQLDLDAPTFTRSHDLLEAALAGGRRLTRPDAMAMLEAAGIATGGQRGYHILWRLAQEGLLVLGPMDGRQQTIALLEEWVPAGPIPPREQALADLAARYFTGHGPATIDDLARWAGIPKHDATAALDAVAGTLESAEYEDARYWFAPRVTDGALAPGVRLLPGFDEYMLGYTGRTHQLGEHLETYGSKVASNGMLAATVVSDGRAIGTWRRTLKARTVAIAVHAFRPVTAAERRGISRAADAYGRFLDGEASVDMAEG